MATSEEIILKLIIESGGAIKSITEVKAQMKVLKQFAEEGVGSEETLTAAKKRWGELNKTVKDFGTEIRKVKAASNTIQEMRDNVSELNKQWKNTTIGTDEFKKLEVELRNSTDKLKAFETAVGDNRRNVGDYKGALVTLENELKSLRGTEQALINVQKQIGTSGLAAAKGVDGLSDELKDLIKSGASTEKVLGQIAIEQKKVSSSIGQTTHAVGALGSKLDETGKSIVSGFGQKMKEQFINIGLAIAGAFAVSKIIDFAKETFKLGLEAIKLKF